MIELRCKNCNKKLFEGDFQGWITTVCPRCKRYNKFESQSYQSYKLLQLEKQNTRGLTNK